MKVKSIKQFLSSALLLSVLPPLNLFAEPTDPSFDCTRAESDAEKLVCSDEQLALLDSELARIYKLAINTPSLNAKGKKYLRASQRGWIKGRDEAWKVKDKKRYVSDVYLLRIGEIRKEHPAARVADNEGISSGPVGYDCSEKQMEAYFVQTDSSRAVIYLEDVPFVFTRVPSGSGAKYIGNYADGKVEFWSKGEEAFFTTKDGEKLECNMSFHDGELKSPEQDDTHSSQEKIALPTDIAWAWQISRYNNDTELKPEESNRYIVRFKNDGSLQIQADCNQVGGQYTADGKLMSFTLGPSTMASCGTDSRDRQFIQDLQGVAGWFLKNERLYLDIKYDTGTMEFSR